MLLNKLYLITSFLESITISGNDILKTIRYLDIDKAYGHDDISIRMLKICGDIIVGLSKTPFCELSQSGRVF